MNDYYYIKVTFFLYYYASVSNVMKNKFDLKMLFFQNTNIDWLPSSKYKSTYFHEQLAPHARDR